MEEHVPVESNLAEGDDIKYYIYKYLSYWPLFIISILVFGLGAYFYLKYSTPIYYTSTQIKILDDDESGIDLSGLSNSSALFNYSKVNLANEIQVFKSRRLVRKVVEDLNLNNSYYKINRFTEESLFNQELPFRVLILKESEKALGSFDIEFQNDKEFKISKKNLEEYSNYKLGDTITKFELPIVVYANPGYIGSSSSFVGNYSFSNSSVESMVSGLAASIDILAIGDRSDILSAGIRGPNKEKNEAVLNTLVRNFNLDGIEDKRLISKNTKEFVIERLKFLEKELDTVESGLVEFKEKNDVVTVESSTSQLFTKEAGSEAERFKVATQIAIAEQFEDFMDDQDSYQLLPANLGIESPVINQLTTNYNQLVLDRNRLLVSSTEENPIVLQINSKLEQLGKNISSNLDNYLDGLRISYQRQGVRENQYTGEINSLPQKEKEIRTIMRQQGIKERLYLFLLQKREEAALSYAITAPTLKVVDFAFTSKSPVSPKKQMIYLGALALGMMIPLGGLYAKFTLNTKLNQREDLDRLIPEVGILGEIPQIGSTEKMILQQKDQSALAEAFRIIRTNLFHFVKADFKKYREQGNAPIIFVTSSVKGEGKTFTAVNLSSIIASSDKKVLLIGCDLRNPQLHQYFNMDKDIAGVSNYLYNPTKDLRDMIVKSPANFNKLDVLFSGSVPPNPAELLMGKEFSEMIGTLKKEYDYIVVDTAPTIYVTDTFLMAEEADLTVYMTKQNITEKKLVGHIKSIKKNNKLKNIALIFNGVTGRTNFGYGYGYVYEDKRKPFYKFWK